MTPDQVKAHVIDIRPPNAVTPKDLVVDANVLYWVFYPNFASLTYARNVPDATPVQFRNYSGYWTRAAKASTRFYTATTTLGEFTKLAELNELEAIWLTDPVPPQPDPASPVSTFNPRMGKFVRYHYAAQLHGVRTSVATMVASIRKSVTLLPQMPSSEELLVKSSTDWIESMSDYPDAEMATVAKTSGLNEILSDDADVATIPGITLYTSNQKAINAARAAGKLK